MLDPATARLCVCVCRWKRRFGCSRNSAVSAARFESGFRERDGQGQHWRGPHSHGGFLKMIVCESGGHANGLTYFIFRFLRRPLFSWRWKGVKGGEAVHFTLDALESTQHSP